MNFKFVFSFLSLICLVSRTCAWKWQNALALNEALRNFINNKEVHAFLGKDVTKMNDEEKMKICIDATTKVFLSMLPHIVMKASEASDLVVGIPVTRYNIRNWTFSVFSCGKTEKKTYYFGKGPRVNTIAVYILPKDHTLGAPLGIMDYSSQLQESQAPRAWKWYDADALHNVLKNFIGNEEEYPFLGKNVTKMEQEEKMNICTDAATKQEGRSILPPIVTRLSDVRDVTVRILVNESNKDETFSVFSCGETEEKTYFFGEGPYENTIAIYALRIGEEFASVYGIMDYSWQPQQ